MNYNITTIVMICTLAIGASFVTILDAESQDSQPRIDDTSNIFSASCAPATKTDRFVFSTSCAPMPDADFRTFSLSCAPEPMPIPEVDDDSHIFSVSCAPATKTDRFVFSTSCAPMPDADFRMFSLSCVLEPTPIPEVDDDSHIFSVSCAPATKTEPSNANLRPIPKHTISEFSPKIPSSYTRMSITHAFNSDQMKMAYDDANVMLVIGHGIGVPSTELHVRRLFVETVPVFVSSKRDLSNISLSRLKKVIEGKINKWSDLDSSDSGSIHLYLHGGRLQEPKFKALLRREKIHLNLYGGAHIIYLSDYDKLLASAASDPQALALGLRSVKPDGVKILTLDGKHPLDIDAIDRYPLLFPVFLATRYGLQGKKMEAIYLRAVARRQHQDENLSVDPRMEIDSD